MKFTKEHFKKIFSTNEAGKKFFRKYGDELLEENRKDVEKLRVLKEYDFGQKTFKSMLANNQSMLINAENKKGDILIARGLSEIDKTNFFNEKEKEVLKKEYLNTGICNLALSDEKEAYIQAEKHFQGDKAILDKIGKIVELRKDDEVNKQKDAERKKYLANLYDVTSLWQQKEKGEIGGAEFYVLNSQYDKDLLWGNDDVSEKGDLIDAYKILRKMNNGKMLNNEEVKDAENYLIKAYKKGKIGFNQVVSLQDKIMQSQTDFNSSKGFFDKDIDLFIDNVFIKDIDARDDVAKSVMEDKARLGLDIYETYYDKKMAMYQDFINQGGVLNSHSEKVLNKRALDETKVELGYKENLGRELTFGELRPILMQYYSGNNEEEIWKKFYQIALFSDDKKNVLKNIAKAQQKTELSYPRYDSLREVEQAGLAEGDKFYFRGRLSVKG